MSDCAPELPLGKRRVAQAFERTHEDVPEVAPLILDPPSVLARQKHPPSKLGRRRGLCPSLVELPLAECRLSPFQRGHRRVDIHPGIDGQGELIAAERTPQGARTVDATLLEQRAQLRRQHPECLLPRRRKVLAPQQLGQLVTRDRPSVLDRQVCEQNPTLPARETLLVQPHAVCLDGEMVRHRDSNAQPACLLPTLLAAR